jgi:hypothetical protein
VHYKDVEKAVRELVAAADGDRRRRFGADAVIRLTADPEVADAATVEFDEDGLQAFTDAVADPANSSVGQLQGWVARIDAGTVSDGDMDPQVLSAISALDRWADYLAGDDADAIGDLAILLLEEVDFKVSANLDDFLGTPEMAAEYARITALLGSATA